MEHDSQGNMRKQRDIVFSRFPPGQEPEAADLLKRHDNLSADTKLEKRAVEVRYDLRDHTFQELEHQLVDNGYHLDNTLMSKLMRALVYYVEDTQLHNLGANPRPIKQTSTAYLHAWEKHPHGDHDDTPPEWREYK
jgi:hypothetical protein